jgi:dUTPase
MSTYRLELLPTGDGRKYYHSTVFSSNENAGVDLYVCRNVETPALASNKKATLLDLGTSARLVCLETNQEVHYWLCPRSSIFKTGLVMANSQGVIDRSYRGVLKAPVWTISPTQVIENFKETAIEGSRLFQIVAPDMGWIHEVSVVDSLPETNRGEGGFGSTGR